MIEICAVGGYGEVGKNMTAVKIDDEVVIFDMGLHMPNYVKFTEEELGEFVKFSASDLKRVKAIPDDSIIRDWRSKVVAIIPSHAHLDHIGAIPYLAGNYNANIICTPFTVAVIKSILRDEKISLPNKIISLPANQTFSLSDNIKVEFVHMTHSTPGTVMVALHTKHGIVLYATDFKFDNAPVLGAKPNYARLKQLGEKGITVALVDSLYAYEDIKTPSEAVARELLKDVMLGFDSRGKAVIVTTFSSHIARLKSIIDFGRQLNRKIVFLGRSLAKYCFAAEDVGIYPFSKQVEIVKFGKHIKRKLKEIEKKGREKFLLVVTGHQGEPKSTLSKMTNKILPFHFKSGDHVIFSCKVIPADINRQQRKILDSQLTKLGVRIFKDIHVSGHAAKQDMREFLELTKPCHVIPVHSDKETVNAFVEFSKVCGYEEGKSVHKVFNSQRLKL
ncbi:RNase J family beta-CASP ribonuclease [Candidatus Woesearchaeota archaeon]|nr:RNase J family beta-CASP ribonuclease [Candidatus Woesearchaeota archaeon]